MNSNQDGYERANYGSKGQYESYTEENEDQSRLHDLR
jgi:hypothetical protein